ncbi:STAS domain-containing protein [Nocardioides sp. SR21]|uniref:STAS domain-containing protein n=1 Tax=Nocardioides sp. SR21 TaxID=2919501 RepID=UPI001FA9EA26|nr:STAS domain-containing protein [Nocardioides sp. SR21]
MAHVRCETESRRLRLSGAVLDAADLADVVETLERFAESCHGQLVIDLTAVTELAAPAARHLVEVRRSAAAEGRRVTLLRRHGTPVDDALHAAASSG